jgi:WD40 repeat protein
VISASDDKTLKLWSTEAGRELCTLAGHAGGASACAFSPDGTRVVSASWDGTLKLWEAETGREIRTGEGHTSAVVACAFSPDGAWLVSASLDKTLKLWDIEAGECLATLPLLDAAKSLAHHPARASVASGDEIGSVYLVDVVGITLGPLVVTAVELGNGPEVCCPVCHERHPLQEAWLGREMDCPGSTCTARWRVNPFVVRRTPANFSWI